MRHSPPCKAFRLCFARTYLLDAHTAVHEHHEICEFVGDLVQQGRRRNGPPHCGATAQECRPDRHPIGEVVRQVSQDRIPTNWVKPLRSRTEKQRQRRRVELDTSKMAEGIMLPRKLKTTTVKTQQGIKDSKNH